MTKYITATAGANGDFYVNIDGADGLETNDIVRISFPTATVSTANARLSIDGGTTYYDIKYLTGGLTVPALLLQENNLEITYDGTNFLIKKGSQPTLLWSGTLNIGNTAVLTESCFKYKYLLIRQASLASKAICPVLTDATRIIGVTAYVSTAAIEIIVPRLARSADGKSLTLEAASNMRGTFSSGQIAEVSGLNYVTEIWGLM